MIALSLLIIASVIAISMAYEILVEGPRRRARDQELREIMVKHARIALERDLLRAHPMRPTVINIEEEDETRIVVVEARTAAQGAPRSTHDVHPG